MRTFYIEFKHVDASNADSVDFMTEWSTVEANTEHEAFESNAARFHTEFPNRAIVAQEVV